MRNVSVTAAAALRLRKLMSQKQSGAPGVRVKAAVSPYTPVGYCAGISVRGRMPGFFCGGDAVLGGAPVTEDTIFRVASISKVICAAAILRLVRERRIFLDDSVGELLGISLPKEITPRQLLTHTAALNDELYNRAAEAGEFPSLRQLLPESFFAYEPGTRFSYSNLGAGVAGMLVESITGKTFDDYVREAFFLPYGLDASFHPQKIRRKDKMANCYRVPGNTLAYDSMVIAAQPLEKKPDPMRHYNVPAGKLMISAPALLSVMQRFLREMPELYELQKNEGSVRCNAERGIGFAYAKDLMLSGKTLVGHQGVAYGAVCEAWCNPEDGTTAVLLTNGARLASTGPLQNIGQDGISALMDWAYKR